MRLHKGQSSMAAANGNRNRDAATHSATVDSSGGAKRNMYEVKPPEFVVSFELESVFSQIQGKAT